MEPSEEELQSVLVFLSRRDPSGGVLPIELIITVTMHTVELTENINLLQN